MEGTIVSREIIQPTMNSSLKLSKWKLSSEGWIKGPRALRCEQGRWIFRFVKSLGNCFVLSVELWAIHEALKHAWRLDFHKVIVGTDNTLTFHMLSSLNIAARGTVLVHHIGALIKQEWEVRITFIRRETNLVTDMLVGLTRGRLGIHT
ncbi:uncharacterized protein LOC120116869 [Hibiscus syriacus]|uniref:uncharacterized protein LOC120116869 n=1 Tax=Hibiscus syriacus TaxID=106335 RepID=UPI0019236FAC|nr:uncharacterized protein LOC120116869 [Hibiscus syriacus]